MLITSRDVIDNIWVLKWALVGIPHLIIPCQYHEVKFAVVLVTSRDVIDWKVAGMSREVENIYRNLQQKAIPFLFYERYDEWIVKSNHDMIMK